MILVLMLVTLIGFLQPCLTFTKRCEPVTVPLCRGILYNTTIFPNLLKHQMQAEAALEVHQFWPMVKAACSSDLRLFLCTLYVPPCNVMESPLPPCRHLCESARDGCVKLMTMFGFIWPSFLQCKNFPALGEGMCIGNRPTAFKECGKPLPPTNGYVLDTNQTIGSTVRVGCKPGYFRRGIPPFTITCKENGQWSEAKINCRAQSCGDPGSPRNGRRVGLQFNYLDVVYFTCHHGYVLQGPTSRRCLKNLTWSHAQPLCKPVVCGEPPKIPNSNILVYGQSSQYVYGNKLTYTCLPGFKRLGDDFLYCGKDAKWLGAVPYCEEIHCSKLNAPADGRLMITSENYTREGEQVRYSCHAGFMLFGPPLRTCLSSGRWTGPEPICFKCSEVGTQVFVRKETYFKHGNVRSKSGHKVTVRYDDGKEEDIILLGPGTRHYIIVQDRIPSRNEIFVGSHILAYHTRHKKYRFATVYSKKSKRFVVRYDGLSFDKGVVGLQEIRTLEPPRFCAICKDPGRPPYSTRKDQLTEFIPGMEAVYTCRDKYTLSGSKTRKCLTNGMWTGSDVMCTRTRCQPCPNPEVRKVCNESILAVIAKVISRLPNDEKRGLLRYAIDVQYVLKNTSLSIQEGRMIVSVPLRAPWKYCACPRIPLKKKFILIGKATSLLNHSKTGFILDESSFAAGWDRSVRRQIKLKCAGQVTIPSNIH